MHALLATAALGTTEVKSNEGFAIRLGLLSPQSRGRITLTSADLDAPLLIDPAYLSAEADLTALEADVKAEIDDAVKFAEQSPPADEYAKCVVKE